MSELDKYSETYVDERAYDLRTTSTGNFRNRKLWICKHFEKEEHHELGYTVVKFRVGITNHVWWSRSFSNIWSGLTSTVNKINEAEKLQIKYFDNKSGKMVPCEEVNAIILESAAKQLISEDKLNEAKFKLEDAYLKSKILHERIKNSLDTVKLALKGFTYMDEKNFTKAHDLFQEAYNKSTELEFYTKFKQLRDSVEQLVEIEKEEREEKLKQEMKRVQLDTAAERLFNKGFEYYKQGDYHKAIDKFQDSHLKASPGSINEYKYIWWKAECLSRMTLYDEAIIEYNNAISIITDSKKKQDCMRQKDECTRKKLRKESKQKVIRLEEEAMNLARKRKFAEAESKFQNGLRDLTDEDFKTKEKIHGLIDLIRMAVDGMKLANEYKYEEAYHKFEEAYFKSNDHKLYKIFLAEMDFLKPLADEQKKTREENQIIFNLVQQGIDLANKTKYKEALLKLEEAKLKSDDIEFARKTQNSIDSIKLANEAMSLSNENKYTQSILKYNEAYTLAEDVILRNKFLIQMNSIKLKRVQKANKLFEKGKFLSNQGKYTEAIVHFESAQQECGDDSNNSNIFSWWKAEAFKKNQQYVDAVKEYDNVIPKLNDSIIKEDCILQRDECLRKQKRIILFERGQYLNLKGKHSEATEIFNKIQNDSIDDNANNNSNSNSNQPWWKADSLNKLDLLNEALTHYNSAILKVINSVENENCTRQRDECLRRISEKIKQNKQLFKEGLASWNRVWQSESSCKNADKHLNDAKSKLCIDFFDDETFSQKDLEELRLVIDLKLEGNKYLNEGHVWEKLANKLNDDGKLHEAIENLETALQNFKKSKEKFTDGLKYEQRFAKSIDLVDNVISRIHKSISEIETRIKKNTTIFTIEEETC